MRCWNGYRSGARCRLSAYALVSDTATQESHNLSVSLKSRIVLPFWYRVPAYQGCCVKSDTHTHTFSGPFSGTTRVSRYQKGKTNLDFTEARNSEWQWHQLGHMQVCTSLQTDSHASTPPLSFFGCPSCRPTNSVKALKD